MSFHAALIGCLSMVAILSTTNPQPQGKEKGEDNLNPFFDVHPLLPDLFSFILLGAGLLLIQSENGTGTYDALFIFWIGIILAISIKAMLKVWTLYFASVKDSVERMTEWDV